MEEFFFVHSTSANIISCYIMRLLGLNVCPTYSVVKIVHVKSCLVHVESEFYIW